MPRTCQQHRVEISSLTAPTTLMMHPIVAACFFNTLLLAMQRGYNSVSRRFHLHNVIGTEHGGHC